MKYIFSNDVMYMFYVSIILINVEIISSEGEKPAAYVTDIYYSWKEAKERCKMVRFFDKIQFPNTDGKLGWIDAPVKYSPWYEYKACVNVKPEFIEKHKRVSYGDQLEQCLHFCEDYYYIGLQQSNCSCLSLSEISIHTVISGCSLKEICKGDKYAYCANGTTNGDCFTIYKQVNINEHLQTGNCLSVQVSYNQESSLTAKPCGSLIKPLCKTYALDNVNGHSEDWISSFGQCKSGLFVSYDIYKESNTWTGGLFWLANIRRPIINHSSDILVITLVITAVLAVVVVIVVICLCVRRQTSSRSRNQQTPVPTNEVTYAQVNKPTKEKAPDHAGESIRNNTADDTYDHTEHHRLNQNQVPTESNYDTMQSVGNEELESDYDVTSGTDRPRQIVVDDTAEYSHVQVEHHETKDPSA